MKAYPRSGALLRALLLLGVAWLAFGPTAADAQANRGRPAPTDGLGDRGFYLEADTLFENDETKTVTARGNVEARYQSRTLRADEIVYDRETGTAVATGNVEILNPDGTSQFADSLTLDDEMRAGVATGFSARLEDNVKIASATAVRRSESVDELNYAIFTPCEICETNPAAAPTWSIRARRAVRDRDRRIVYYRGAVVEVKGTPVFYAPVLWHADPTAERQSGFLTPRIGLSSRRGLSVEPRYLWVLSPSSEIVGGLQINTQVNPMANIEFRKRFYSGVVNLRAGYTYEREFGQFDRDGDGVIESGEKNIKFGEATSRSYILGDGLFDISPDWRWGFTAERTSDPLLFQRYDVPGYETDRRGLYKTDDKRLISQAFLEHQARRSYGSIAVVSIQGLRPGDDADEFPLVAPIAKAKWEPGDDVLGGRLRLRSSAVSLTRELDPNVSSRAGIDSQRLTGEVDWRRAFFFRNGLRVDPFVQGRLDFYHFSDQPGPEEFREDTATRALGVVGVDLSYPLFRTFGSTTVVLEPLAQIAISPESELVEVGRVGGRPVYLNEDSTVFEFDENNLFRANKSPGFDLYEGGQRLNVGGRATVWMGGGREASLLVGRSFRTEDDPTLPARTGLSTKASDWIVAGAVKPTSNSRLFARARLDDENGEIHRLEAGGAIDLKRLTADVRYVKEDQSSLGREVEDLTLSAEVLVTRHWGLTGRGVADLDDEVWRRQELGVFYEDDCTRLEVIYSREETRNRSIGPSQSLNVRLSLATLGSTR